MQKLCGKCKQKQAHVQICDGDGKIHRHGAVHTVNGKLLHLCDDCKKTDKKEWDALKEHRKENK